MTPEHKQELRNKLSHDVNRFLNAGGKIQEIPINVYRPEAKLSEWDQKNARMQRRRKAKEPRVQEETEG